MRSTGSKVEPISFRKKVTPLLKDDLFFEVPADGTIESVRMTFAQGQHNDLHVMVSIIEAGTKNPTEVIVYPEGSNNYVSGDNVVLVFNCTRAVTINDKIRVRCESVDAVNDMSLAVDIEVDYYGGMERVV